MTDIMSEAKRRALMGRIRGRDTYPERALRRLIWSRGFRYRTHDKVEGVRPDLVFRTTKVVVFVDGCFWHMCPRHFVMPVTNRAFWKRKLARNRERDVENRDVLKRAGWRVIRIWEHEVEAATDHCAERVLRVLRQREG